MTDQTFYFILAFIVVCAALIFVALGFPPLDVILWSFVVAGAVVFVAVTA